MRSNDYLRVTLKDLKRQAVRTSLTVSALALSSLILVTLLTLNLNVRNTILNQLSPNNNLNTITVTTNKASGFWGGVEQANTKNLLLNDHTVTQLQTLPHVTQAAPRAMIWEFATFQVTGTTPVFVAQTLGIGPETATTLPLLNGHRFAAGTNNHEAILGYGYLKQLGYTDPNQVIGKTITITTQKGYRGSGASIPGPLATTADINHFNQTTTTLSATVIGVTTNGSNQNNLFIPMGWATQIRDANYWEYNAVAAAKVANPSSAPYDAIGTRKTVHQLSQDGYSSIVVEVDAPQYVTTVAKNITNLGYGEVAAQAVVQQFMTFSTIVWVVLGSVALITLFAASLGIVNTMLMAVSEQRYSIAVWRVCGASKRQIARQFLLQTVVLGLIGGLIGVGGSLIITHYVNAHLVRLLVAHNLTVVAIPMPPPWLIGGGILLTICFSVLAGLYPAWAAARQDPSKALAAS